MQLHSKEQLDALEQWHPGLFTCLRMLWALPLPLQEALGLQLRVPQQLMVASYPPGKLATRSIDGHSRAPVLRL